MNRISSILGPFYFLLLFICCAGKSNPELEKDSNLNNDYISQNETDSTSYIKQQKFYQLEKSIKDIKKEIDLLQNQVSDYQYAPPKTNYVEKLKELINEQESTHKITLLNGSIIEGVIKKDEIDALIIQTDVGKLTISKKEIENIADIILPQPDIVFVGHGQEEIFDSFRLFRGKVINQGNRRGIYG